MFAQVKSIVTKNTLPSNNQPSTKGLRNTFDHNLMVVAGLLCLVFTAGTPQTFASGLVPANPGISPWGNTYRSGQTVTLSDATTGAVIYYTTDGSTPHSKLNSLCCPNHFPHCPAHRDDQRSGILKRGTQPFCDPYYLHYRALTIDASLDAKFRRLQRWPDSHYDDLIAGRSHILHNKCDDADSQLPGLHRANPSQREGDSDSNNWLGSRLFSKCGGRPHLHDPSGQSWNLSMGKHLHIGPNSDTL